MIRPTIATLAAILLLASLPASALAQTVPQDRQVQADEPTTTGRAVISAGHVDLGPRFVNGAFEIQLRDDSAQPAVWRELSDVVLVVPPSAALPLPDDPRFAFLGQAGANSYVLPQVQDERLVWPGWNTQDPRVTASVRRQVSWSLEQVDGPGRFSLFSTDGFGEPQVLFDSSRALPQRFPLDLDTHGHGSWAFSAPGIYQLQIAMAAATKDRGTVSGRATLQFAVGDVDPQTAFSAQDGATAGTTDGNAPPWLAIAGVAALITVLLLAYGAARRRSSSRTAAS